ncbi:hypothetical protein C8Q70DRAFT_118729 [Cubamyces menziesii]|nr:hypothetical protein C8Q70DRAFT_118729 [Cubamyces menziesii]
MGPRRNNRFPTRRRRVRVRLTRQETCLSTRTLGARRRRGSSRSCCRHSAAMEASSPPVRAHRTFSRSTLRVQTCFAFFLLLQHGRVRVRRSAIPRSRPVAKTEDAPLPDALRAHKCREASSASPRCDSALQRIRALLLSFIITNFTVFVVVFQVERATKRQTGHVASVGCAHVAHVRKWKYSGQRRPAAWRSAEKRTPRWRALCAFLDPSSDLMSCVEGHSGAGGIWLLSAEGAYKVFQVLLDPETEEERWVRAIALRCAGSTEADRLFPRHQGLCCHSARPSFSAYFKVP